MGYTVIAPKSDEELTFHGIPFQVERKEGCVTSLVTHFGLFDEQKRYPVGQKCGALCFLGMTTQAWECSEWWGQSERFFNYNGRLFIGDKVGRIHVVYEDDQEDVIPVLFGINVWNYDLFEQPKKHEVGLTTFSGPYREPFASDCAAEKLFYDSMVCMENNGEKAEKSTKWTFVLKTNPDKAVQYVRMSKDCKNAGFNVSAITALDAGSELDANIRAVDSRFFLRKDYFMAADRLARRLYQFRDELPGKDTKIELEGYDGPDVNFFGNGLADIFTNVYQVNMMDMAHIKIDETGRTHTSSKNPWEFGFYCGMGSYAKSTCYYDHVWSRDVGRTVVEVANAGYRERTRLAADDFHELLYYPIEHYKMPHWKRIANFTPEHGDIFHSIQGKENDGHAAMMLGIFSAFNKGYLSLEWLQANKRKLFDAANWFVWQIQNPKESGFDKVLCSNSEASTQTNATYDLFSNTMAATALQAYAKIFAYMQEPELEDMCNKYAKILHEGCREVFLMQHPRYGKVYTDTIDDCWTYEYKRFIPLFIKADTVGYDIHHDAKETFDVMDRTFKAQKEEFYYPEAGRQMGYGQGYLTQAVLMLDDFEELTKCVETTAMFCYHHSDVPYMVPEGVVISGNKQCWYRNSDLGNAVQQGETIKSARLVIGLDDIDKTRGLRIVPRLPDSWQGMDIKDYGLTDTEFALRKAEYRYERMENGYKLHFASDQPMEIDYVRVGPFLTDKLSANGHAMKIVQIGSRYFAYIAIGAKTDKLDISVTQQA